MIEIKHKSSGLVLHIHPAKTLRGANLQGLRLASADLERADLRGANLSRANLSHANLCGANLRSVDLRGANLRGADLRGADLAGSALEGANLQGAFVEGDLFRGSLASAVSWAARLGLPGLFGTYLKDATYDSDTKWPEAFDPRKRGAKRGRGGGAPPVPASPRGNWGRARR